MFTIYEGGSATDFKDFNKAYVALVKRPTQSDFKGHARLIEFHTGEAIADIDKTGIVRRLDKIKKKKS